MSAKTSAKRSPRAMPVETIITRFKSSQRRKQSNKDQAKSVLKSKGPSKMNTKNASKTNNGQGNSQTLSGNVGHSAVGKLTDDVNAEFYPEKLKRKVLNRKIVLVPRHRLKMIGGINSCNKRKLRSPRKETKNRIKRRRYHSNSSALSDYDPNSPSHKVQNSELTIKDMVLLIEEEGGLDEEDLLEILTCPSPVWWEDPPPGYLEDPIFARPKPSEQMSVKNQLLDEQNKEAKRKKQKEDVSMSATDVNKDKLDILELDIGVQNRSEHFITKRGKLEFLLGNIRNKVQKPSSVLRERNKDTNSLIADVSRERDNETNIDPIINVNTELHTKNNRNNDESVANNSSDTDDLQIDTEDVSKCGSEKKDSDSFDDNQILDLADYEILSLENIEIPIAPKDTSGDKIDDNLTSKIVISSGDSCTVIKNDILCNNANTTESLTSVTEEKINQVNIETSSTKNIHTSNINLRKIDVSSKHIKDKIPYIRVKKIETLSAKPVDKRSNSKKESENKDSTKVIISNKPIMVSKVPSLLIKPSKSNTGTTGATTNKAKNIPYVRVRKIETLIAKPVNTKESEIESSSKTSDNVFNHDIIDITSPPVNNFVLSELNEVDAYMAVEDNINDNGSEVQSISLDNEDRDNDTKELDISSDDIESDIPTDGEKNNVISIDSTDHNDVSFTQSVSDAGDIDSRRSSLESEGSDKNMSEEYLDMSLFDEDDKMEFINNDNEAKDDNSVCELTSDVDTQSNNPYQLYSDIHTKSQIDVSDNTFNEINKLDNDELIEYIDENHDNDILIDKCIDYNENFSPLISQNTQRNTDAKESTEYIAVYKIINSDSENEVNMLKRNYEIVKDKPEVTKTSDVDKCINYYYKQRKLLRRMKKKDKHLSSDVFNKDKPDNTVKNSDCVSCSYKNKSIVISDNSIKYCLLCSSIFDTDECKYCIGKYNKKCSCRIHETGEYECDMCSVKVSCKKEFIEHFNGKHS